MALLYRFCSCICSDAVTTSTLFIDMAVERTNNLKQGGLK